MNEITAITPQAKDKTRCNVYVDGRFCCGLTLETVMKSRLKVGQIVTQEEMEAIQLDSEKMTAFDKALNYISTTWKTEKQIRKYLSDKGYLPVVIDYAVEKLRYYNYLNDGEYAETYVGFASKRKGRKLIKMELRSKGISEREIDEALGTLSGEQELDSAKAILEKYMRGKTADVQTLQKAYRYLMGKGFDYETAKAAVSALGACDED
ncbi:MAG: RecX family transcriptional regulator [Clostridia bacterium]|nr:RecX family transcriptional regulator [Clostridia bacterium]